MSEVLIPVAGDGVPCPLCGTKFVSGWAEGQLVDGAWHPYITCSGCSTTLRLHVGFLGPNGVSPWALTEVTT